MKLALAIDQFPVSAVDWIAVQGIPTARILSDLSKMRIRESENPLAHIVGDETIALLNPPAGQYRFQRLQGRHCTAIVAALACHNLSPIKTHPTNSGPPPNRPCFSL